MENEESVTVLNGENGNRLEYIYIYSSKQMKKSVMFSKVISNIRD